MNKKSFPSLESLEEGGFNAGAEVMADHTDAVAGYAYSYDEMMDGRAEENCVDAIEGAETEIASLESLLEAINEARDVGMEAYSAQFANIQITDAQKRYGVDSVETMFPSMECFQGRQARMATSVSMESVKETIAKIWAWIQEKFKLFVEMVKKFYQHLTKNLDLVVDEANRLKNIARKMNFEGGPGPHSKHLKLGRAGRNIMINGGIPGDMTTITSILNDVGQANRVPEEKFEKIRNDIVAAIDKNKEGFNPLPASLTGEVPLPANFTQVAMNKYGGSAGAKKTYASKLLPGDRHIVVDVYGDDNTSTTFEFSSGQFVTGKVRTYVVPQVYDSGVFALSSDDVFTLCQRIVKAAASLKTSRYDMEDHFKRTQQTIDTVLRKHQGDEVGPIGDVQRKLATWFYKTNGVYAGALSRHIEGVGYDICVGFLNLARRSIEINQPGATA